MLGDILRQEREKKNLTIKDVEQETSIRALYLSSIEEGKYGVIPGEVYLRGFIKTYANFLQLDSAEMLKLYTEEKTAVQVPAAQGTREITERKEEIFAPAAQRSSLRDRVKEEKPVSSRAFSKIGLLLLVIVCICAAGYAVFGGAETRQEASTPPAAQQTKQKAAPAKPAETAKPAQTPKKEPAVQQPLAFQAKFTERCWTKVVADGKVVLEETVDQGAVLNWKAQKTLEITLGNAQAVELSRNGKSQEKLGASGEVVTKTFHADAAAEKK